MLRMLIAWTLTLTATCWSATPLRGQCHQQRPCVRDKATIVVNVPSDARLFLNGQPTASTGPQRSFETPLLEAGKHYSYQLKMEVQRAGQVSSDVKTVSVRAGQVTRVLFAEPVVVRPKLPPSTAGLAQSPLKIESIGDLRHPSVIRAVAITPDSQKAFVALNDGSVLAYSLGTQKLINVSFRTKNHGAISDLALDARGDRIAVADADGFVTLLNATTLQVVNECRLTHIPTRLAYAPSGAALFVAVSDGRLLKLSPADLTTIKEIAPTPASPILALACSRDGIVATSHIGKQNHDGRDIQVGIIRLWSADSLEPQGDEIASKHLATSLAFDPARGYLVSGGADAALKLWKLADLSLVKESKDYHQMEIACIAFAPDGRMVTGGYDGLCQFWDSKSLEASKSYPNYRGYVTACAISADGRWLVRGGSSLDFVPMDRPEEFERVADYGGTIMGLAVAPNRKHLATGGMDRRLISWEIDKGIASKSALLDDWVTAVEFCDEGKAIAAGLVNGTIEVYSAATMQRVKSWVAHDGRVTSIATVRDSLVSIGDDGVVRVWDHQGNRLRSYDEKSPCRSIAVYGSKFAVGAANGTVSVYDLAAALPVHRLQGRPLSVTALAFARGGKRIIVGSFDGSLESFDTQSWSPLHFHAGKGESVLSIDANPNNDLLAVGFRDGYARLYNADTFQEEASARPGPGREIFAVRWALQDNTFAVAGASNSVTFLRLNGDVAGLTQKVR